MTEQIATCILYQYYPNPFFLPWCLMFSSLFIKPLDTSFIYLRLSLTQSLFLSFSYFFLVFELLYSLYFLFRFPVQYSHHFHHVSITLNFLSRTLVSSFRFPFCLISPHNTHITSITSPLPSTFSLYVLPCRAKHFLPSPPSATTTTITFFSAAVANNNSLFH